MVFEQHLKGGGAVTREEFAVHVSKIRIKLFKTAMMYLRNEHDALEAVDEAVYKGLCAVGKLRESEYFDTWITRIVINECYKLIRQNRREERSGESPELSCEDFDGLPLKEAVHALPKELHDVILLRFFGGYTLAETAEILKIPQGTAATRQRRALGLLRLSLEDVDREKEAENGL